MFNSKIFFIAFFFCLLAFTNIAKAETAQTTFYFQKDGQPLTQPIKFVVKCYEGSGYSGTGAIVKSSEFSGECLIYGCKIDTSNNFWYGLWHNYGSEGSGGKYCNLEAEINGSNFTINNIIKFVAPTGPIKGVGAEYKCVYNCLSDKDYPDYPLVAYLNGTYPALDYIKSLACYNKTPQYEKCSKEVEAKFSNKQITCGGTYSDKTRACFEKLDREEDQEEISCEKQYFQVITKDQRNRDTNKEGSFFDQLCEFKINITDANINIPAIGATSSIKLSQHKSSFDRIINFLKCSFLKIFKKSC